MDGGDLEKARIRFHFTVAGGPEKRKPAEMKTNHLHPPLHPLPPCHAGGFVSVIITAPCQGEPGILTYRRSLPQKTTLGHPREAESANSYRASALGEEKQLGQPPGAGALSLPS